ADLERVHPRRGVYRVTALIESRVVSLLPSEDWTMPSPFPGMDPYLEGALWTTLYHSLGTEIVRQLAPKLRPRYVALPVERFVMDLGRGVASTTASIYPDVGITEAQPHAPEPAGATTVPAPLRLATIMPEAVPM